MTTAPIYMLSSILASVTGESLLDYLRPRLLEPLGYQRYIVGAFSSRSLRRRLGLVCVN